jgi:hypothetical protein
MNANLFHCKTLLLNGAYPELVFVLKLILLIFGWIAFISPESLYAYYIERTIVMLFGI